MARLVKNSKTFLDYCYEFLLQPGMNELSANLQEMREKKQPNSEMVDCVYEFLEKHNLIPNPAKLEEKKSDGLAEEFRGQGNALYIRKKRNVDAIVAYNKSMCYAESQENISIGLANRSAVFFQMQLYPECVESIRLAREAGIPERLKEKLDRRKVECKEKIKKTQQKTEQVFVPKIELPVNEKIPFLAKCLSLREDSTFGRYVVAEEDIPAGKIIALEESYCKILFDTEIYLRCANCLAEVPHLLLPCSTCTQTMFCSKECEKEAFEDFHAIECPISGSMMKLFCDEGHMRLCIRMIIRAFVTFQGDTEKMEAALEKMEREKKSVFDFDWSQELSPEEVYTTIHTLCTNENVAMHTQIYKYVTACIVLKLLQWHSPAFKERFLTSSKAICLLKNVVLRHVLIAWVNTSGALNSVEDTADLKVRTEIGHFISPFYPLMNHSCRPSVEPFTYKTSAGIITIKKIAAGEQIFISYNYNCRNKPMSVRCNELMRKYDFICKCVACTEKYPTMLDMDYPEEIEDISLDSQELSEEYSFDYCYNGFNMAKDYIHKYGHLYPIIQVGFAEEAIKFCLQFLCGNISLRLKEKVRLSLK